uniref:CSON015500 protein n=1 Tax=Culicoides sonorensis TaxID=179676 RepID=A0A336LNU6_CULSO
MQPSMEELITDWNALLTYKLKESDLMHPTETFIIKALSSLLGAMGIKDCYTLKMHSENKVEAGIAKAKFVRFIDELYKVSDVKHHFLYIDLVHPTSKKTFHLLRVLHNYFCYYEMLKKNVLGYDTEKLMSRDRLMKLIKDRTIKNEQLKMQKDMMASKIESYSNEIPVLQNQVQETKSHIKTLNQEIDERKYTIEAIRASNRDALKKIEYFNDELVDEEEIKKLMSDMQKFKQELNELKERGSAMNTRLLEGHHKKEELESIISETENLIQCLDIDSVIEHKTRIISSQQNLDELKKKLSDLEQESENNKKYFEMQVKANTKKIATQKKKNKMQDKKMKTIQKEIIQQEKILNELEDESTKLHAELERNKNELEQVFIIGEKTLLKLSGKNLGQCNSSECA